MTGEQDQGWDLQERVVYLGTVEKATETITCLKEYLVLWRNERKRSIPSLESGRRLKISPSFYRYSHDSNVSFSEPECDKLVIQGLKTGQLRKKYDWSNADEIIMQIMSLINRLEEDRVFTVEKYIKERNAVIRMRKLLDEKAIERLKILPLLVQQEHERFMKDVLELKWHISFEGRHLQFIRDEVKLVTETNQEYKSNLERTNNVLTLLQNKLDTEGDQMASIIQRQGETEMELKQSKKDLDRTTEKTHQTRIRIEAETRKMTRTIEELTGKLNTSIQSLNVLLNEKDELNKTKESLHSKIANIAMDSTKKTDKLESLNLTKSEIEKNVSVLRDRRKEQEETMFELMERNVALKKRMKEKLSSLDSRETVLLSEIQRLGRELKATRQENNDIVCEIDEMKEQSAASLKNYKDDIKSIERARRELIKIDKQLQVILFETDTVRSEHRQLMEEYKSEELKLGSVEDSLRTAVQSLKQDYQKEMKTKITYQGKIQADTADLEKMTVENERSEKKTRTKALEINTRTQKSMEKAKLLESIHQTKYNEEATIREQIKDTKNELENIESVIGGTLKSLTTEKTNLECIVKDKKKRVNDLTEREKQLNEKIIDTTKSSNMIERMESDTLLAIEALEVRKQSLHDKIKDEEIEEQSWREELNSITEFSHDSRDKYTQYMIEREKYLKQLEYDEVIVAQQNRSLSIEYQQLMEQHVNIKTTTLHILEHQLELEAALKDLGQLLALQTKLSNVMLASYKNRSITGIKDLQRFKNKGRDSSNRLCTIHMGLETVLSNITHFLNTFDNDQTMLITTRHRNISFNNSGIIDCKN